METNLQLVPFKDRRYEEIPVDKIKVINSRDREEEQFEMNTESIEHVGLLKPIRVNDRFLERTGLYELICGEGRLIAHKRLNAETVKAEVVTCTRKEAYLQSLIENIARTKPDSMEFARELKRLHDEGWTYERNRQGRLQEPQLRSAIHQAGRARGGKVDSRRRAGCLPDQIRHAGRNAATTVKCKTS